MGFGLIFTGYISLFCLRLLPVDIFGFFMMFLGFKKLAYYNESFKRAGIVSLICFVYSLIYGAFWVLNMTKIIETSALPSLVTFIESLCYYSLLFLLHFYMYSGISKIAKESDFDKAIKKSKNCLSIATVYYACTFIYYILLSIPGLAKSLIKILNPMFLALNLLMLVWIFMTAALIYSCYRILVTDEILEKEHISIEKFNSKYGKKKK